MAQRIMQGGRVVLALVAVASGCTEVPVVADSITSHSTYSVHGPGCVPELSRSPTGVPCLVLVTFADATGPASSGECASFGGGAYANVDPTVLEQFNAQAIDDDGGLANRVTCTMNQVLVADASNTSCADEGTPGWCYVTGGESCPQAIVFSSSALVPDGATTTLQCIAPS